MKFKIALTVSLLSISLMALEVGKIPPNVTIDNDNGGMALNGKPWNSASIQGKVYIIFYVDPDEKDLNSHFSDMLKAKKYDKTEYGSIAIVNLAATWKPNFVIEKLLETKQKEFPDTIYVKDKNSVLVKRWGIADNNSDIIIFSKDGRVLFYKAGKLNEEEMKKAFDIIQSNISPQ